MLLPFSFFLVTPLMGIYAVQWWIQGWVVPRMSGHHTTLISKDDLEFQSTFGLATKLMHPLQPRKLGLPLLKKIQLVVIKCSGSFELIHSNDEGVV